jgi:hypothetical protein
MADVMGVISNARQAIGGYFSLVSVLPSVLFVAFAYFLLESGALSGQPNWGDSSKALRDLGLGGSAILVIAAIALSMVMHPVQFVLVQILEGYWGTGRWAVRLRVGLVNRHHSRFAALHDGPLDSDEYDALRLSSPDAFRLISLNDEARRQLTYYPDDPKWIMPTRLGNVLRRFEMAAGRPFGLNGLSVLPHIGLVADDKHIAYLNDQRSALDLAVRGCVVSGLASLLAVVALWDDGLWLLLALIPYAGAYLSYRGAIVTASHYGVAICSVIALNRFALYERLRVELPGSPAQEVRLNDRLEPLYAFAATPDSIRYRRSAQDQSHK